MVTADDPIPFEDPRQFLKRHGLRPKDSFGQCFLTAPHVVAAIVRALEPQPDETLVEIGTGTGTLARALAPRCATVIAIERDRELVAALRAEPLPPNVRLEEADAGPWDYAGACAAGPSAIVGNLPYQITGRLLRAILTPPVRWRTAVVMVQSEVAARLLAAPGDDDWGVLSIFTQAGCTVGRVCNAPPGCFHPAPRVHSTVVKLSPREVVRAAETPVFREVVHALFAARRKTLRNGLAGVVGRERAGEACAAAGIDPGVRPEVLAIEELGRLAQVCAALRAG